MACGLTCKFRGDKTDNLADFKIMQEFAPELSKKYKDGTAKWDVHTH